MHDFLEELHGRVERYLAAHGELALTVRPYDMVVGGEVVYHENDRERSLALRLYRDGVRTIIIDPRVTWDEVSQLVGILALRYKGVRQQEEDIVTLLWKASFAHIRVDAVEGFVAADEEAAAELARVAGGPVAPRNALQAAAFAAPYAFDYPWPELAERRAVSWAPLAAEALEALAAEDAEDALPRQCLDLARELIAALADPAAELAPADVVPVLREVRDFLLAEGRSDLAVEVAATVAAGLPEDAGARRDELLLACLDGRALGMLLARGGQTATLGGLLTPAHLEILLDLLVAPAGTAGDEGLARLADLLAAAAAGRADALRRRLAATTGEAAVRVLRLFHRVAPVEAAQAAVDALPGGDLPVQRECLALLRGAAYGPKVGRALVGALEAGDEELRLGALQHLVKQRERRAFTPIVERLRRHAGGGVSSREASACGTALAMLDGAEALKLFRDWVKPSGGLLGRVLPRHPLLLAAAAGGLARIAGDDADELLRVLAKNGPDEVRAACQAQLARRQGGAP